MAGRPKNNPSVFVGMTLDQWRASDALLEWARDSKELKLIVEVCFNAFHAAAVVQFPDGRKQAGRMGGWAEAIMALQLLSQRNDKPVTLPDPDYGTGAKDDDSGDQASD